MPPIKNNPTLSHSLTQERFLFRHQNNHLDVAFKQRVWFIILFFCIFISLIIVKAIYLQTYKSHWLIQEASKQYSKQYQSSGKRGIIYDRNNRELSVTVDIYSIFCHPEQIDRNKIDAQKIASILQMDYQDVLSKLCSDKKFIWIKRLVSPEQAQNIQAMNINGIYVKSEIGRVYPHRTLAAQLIGFTGIDGNGLEGLEYYYNDYLMGKSTESTILKDAHGRTFLSTNENQGGNHIILTIDYTIQFLTESVVQETVDKYGAKSALAIVMDPHTGEILAMAQAPTFNPNNFQDYDPDLWRNRSITDSFEPGSTMKIFLAAAAIESGKCDMNSLFFCENGEYRIGSKVIHDDHPHDWLTLLQIIKYSSNIGAIKVSEYIGAEYLYRILTGFGFSKKTNIDCPAETSGSLKSVQEWSDLERSTISYGYGISVSALQLITAASAIAKNGILMQPYLVKSIIDMNGNEIYSFSPTKSNKVISKKTAKSVRKMMEAVVEPGGTGESSSIQGYKVCGKTGTSRKINPDGTYSTDKYYASFIGFAPSTNPKIVVLVVVDEPETDFYGGKVCAPAFKRIVYETLLQNW